MQTFGLDERTVAAGRERAGAQGQRVHEAILEQGSLDRVHVPTDELRVKGRALVVWMGLAMMVSTHGWLAGGVSQTHDDELFIERSYRHQGIGTKVMEFALEACRELGVHALHLEVERTNIAGQALYRKFGFEDSNRYLLARRLDERRTDQRDS